jgi:hypothetical protein
MLRTLVPSNEEQKSGSFHGKEHSFHIGKMMMEAARTSEMSIDIQLRKQQYIP